MHDARDDWMEDSWRLCHRLDCIRHQTEVRVRRLKIARLRPQCRFQSVSICLGGCRQGGPWAPPPPGWGSAMASSGSGHACLIGDRWVMQVLTLFEAAAKLGQGPDAVVASVGWC